MENKIVAQVDDRKITLEDVKKALVYSPKEHQEALKTIDGKKGLLNQMVIQEMVYLNAIEKKYDQEEAFITEMENLKAVKLKEYGINKILNGVELTEEEIRVFYDGHKESFKTEETARASHILVDSEEEAEKLLKEIKEGKDFAKTAEVYSKCPSKANGGDLGFFSRGKMVPEFEEAALNLNPGEISGIVKTQFGYHIVKLIEKKEPENLKYEQVRNKISDYLLGQKRNVAFSQKTEELRKQYKIEVNDELLNEI